MTRIKRWLTQKYKKHNSVNFVFHDISLAPTIYGMARLLDLGATLDSYRYINTIVQDDEMMESDWIAVGRDLTNSINYLKNHSSLAGTAETQL